MPTLTATASEARANFSQIAKGVYETGQPVTVFKNSKPWVQIVSSDFSSNVDTGKISTEKASTEDDDYIELVAGSVRKSKQQFACGQFYSGSNTLFEMLEERQPELWG